MRRSRDPGRWMIPLILLGLLACSRPAPSTRIVLITLDTLRYDSFAGAGDGESDMPLLRGWAERGRQFDAHYSASSTTQPSHASLFTGLHPWQHGVTRNGTVLHERHVTVAESLRALGYSTAAVVGSFPLHRRFGYAQGFDAYTDRFDHGRVRRWGGTRVDNGGRFYSLAEEVTARALGAIDASSADRQFFWFHYFDPHTPYGDAREPAQRVEIMDTLERLKKQPVDIESFLARAREAYAEDVRRLDRAVNAVLERLAADTPDVETHVLVVADHGESFGEGGSIGHGTRLTPSQVHVPSFLLSPATEPGILSEPVGSIDVATTLLRLAGAEAGASLGRDLTRPLAGEPAVRGMRRLIEGKTEVRTDGTERVLEPHWFFTVEGGQHFRGNRGRVENASGPVVGAEAERLKRLFAGFEDALVAPMALEDEETIEALRALGYVE